MADLASIQFGDGRPPAPLAAGGRDAAAIAFPDLVETWHQTLYRFAFGLSGEAGEAARLTALAFRGWLEGTDWAGPAAGHRGLFAALHREFIRRADPRATAFAGAFAPSEQPASAPSSPHLEALDVVAALQQVSVPTRVPLALMYAGNFTAAEIAAILDQPLAAVLARAASGRIQLVQALQRPAEARPPATS